MSKRRKNNNVFPPPQQSNFALTLTLLKHEMNKRGLNFEGIWWWPVIT